MSSPAVTNTSTAGITELNRSWRSDLMTKPEGHQLWMLLQSIDPEESTRLIQQQIEKMPGYERGSRELAGRIRYWQLNTGLKTDELFEIVRYAASGFDSLKPAFAQKSPFLIRQLLKLPLVDLNQAATLISGTVSAISANSAAAKDAMKACENVDRSLAVAELATAITEVWSLDKQIKLAKDALQPLDDDAMQEVQQEITKLKGELEEMEKRSTFALDPLRLSKIQQLLLLEVRLHPESNQAFLAMLQQEIVEQEKLRAGAVKSVKDASLAVGIDALQLLLEHVDPTTLSPKFVGLAAKTYGMCKKTTGLVAVAASIQEVQEEHALSTHTFKHLKKQATESEKTMYATAEKIRDIYWRTKKEKMIEGGIVKTLVFSMGAIGITATLLKILVVLGVVALGAATFGAFGYATLAIAGGLLIFKLSMAIYRNRAVIADHIRKSNLVVQKSFAHLVEKLGYDRKIQIASLKGRIKKIERARAKHGDMVKLSGVSNRVIRQLGREFLTHASNTHYSLYRAQELIRSMTGKDGDYLKDVDPTQITAKEMQERMIGSLLQQLSM